jgi:hypothetical protein
MKKMLSGLFVMASCLLSFASSDTIVHIAGPSMVVTISHITSSKVFFRYPDKENVFEINRRQVEKIIYKDGRIEVFNKPSSQVVSANEWRSVTLTKEPADVEGLHETGELVAQVSRGRNRKETLQSAEIRLKKEAAAVGANIVLITSTEFKGGYGDLPSVTLTGTGYSFFR